MARNAKKVARELQDDGSSRRKEVELSLPKTEGSVVGKMLR